MSFYVYAETPPPPSLNVRKSSTRTPPTQTTELGPYKFQSAIDFSDFLLIIATGCHTKISNLPIASLKWKFDRPANAAKKGLTNKTAYDVMIKSLVDRKKDYVFSVYMLPPTVVKKELVRFPKIWPRVLMQNLQPWIKDENDASLPDFEYNPSNAASSAVKSIRDQIMRDLNFFLLSPCLDNALYQVAIDTASKDDLNELLEHYPVDNHPLFPRKHIFHNETGFFDLTDMRLRVWAVAKVCSSLVSANGEILKHVFRQKVMQRLTNHLPLPISSRTKP
jgi:hypothetical protein